MTCVWIVRDYKRSYCIESPLLSIEVRTGSTSWPQFAKVTSQVTRLGVRWTAYCERPSCLGGTECQNTSSLALTMSSDMTKIN